MVIFHWGLIWIFPVTNDVENIFMSLLTISSMEYLFTLSYWIVFLLLKVESFYPMIPCYICGLQIFLPSDIFFSNSLQGHIRKKGFNFDEVLPDFPFTDHLFGINFRNSLFISSSWVFSYFLSPSNGFIVFMIHLT